MSLYIRWPYNKRFFLQANLTAWLRGSYINQAVQKQVTGLWGGIMIKNVLLEGNLLVIFDNEH